MKSVKNHKSVSVKRLVSSLLVSTCMVGAFTQPGFAQGANIERLMEQLKNAREAISQTAPTAQPEKPLARLKDATQDADLSDAFTRFPVVDRSNRLMGSDDNIAWTVYLTEEDAKAGGEFVLGFRSSATVLPENSSLELYVNGVRVTVSSIDGASGLSTISTRLRGNGVLKPGANQFSVRARQQHRVDCSFQATRELWTEIVPDASGFRFANPQRRVKDVTQLDALPIGAGQFERINLVMKDWSAMRASKYLELVQTLVTRFDMNNPVVDLFEFAPANTSNSKAPSQNNGSGPALDFFVGTVAEFTSNQGLQSAYKEVAFDALVASSVDKPFVVTSQHHERHLLVYLTDRVPESDFQSALVKEGTSAKPAIFGVPGFEPKKLTLDEAGFNQFKRNGMIDHTVKLIFPAEFYPADYNALTLSLEGKVDLAGREKLDILIYVNGEEQASAVVSGKDIQDENWAKISQELPLMGFRPGVNEIRFSTQLAGESDDACSPKFFENKASFELAGTSTISVPELAMLTTTPDLFTAFHAVKFVQNGKGKKALLVVSPDGDFDSLTVAGTILAQTASQTGKLINVRHYKDKSAAVGTKGQSRLIVTGNPRDQLFDAGAFHTISKADIQGLWAGKETRTIKPIEASPSAMPVSATPSALQTERPTKDQLDKDQFDLKARGLEIISAVSQLGKNALELIFGHPVLANLRADERTNWIDDAEFVISQNHADNALTTIVLHSDVASNNKLSLIGRNQRDAEPNSPKEKKNRLWQEAKIYLDNQPLPKPSLDAVDADRLTDLKYLNNLRLLTAGFLSNNPFVYALSFLVALILSGFFYARVMANTTRCPGEEYERNV